jgi:hypothetical protein
MGRIVAGVMIGCIVWIVVATACNMVLRAALPGYAEAERAMDFTLGMMLARQLVSAASTLLAGAAAAWTAKRNARAATILGLLLTVLFIPVHVGLWDKFPIWYHVLFLASLLPLAALGARPCARRGGNAHVGAQ